MESSIEYYAAVFFGYAIPIAAWFLLTRAYPKLWTPREELDFERPKTELGLAILAVVGVILTNTAYNSGWLIPHPKNPWWLTDLAFAANLVIIWSPVFLVLAWRKQGPGTCLFSFRRIWVKLAWGVAGSIAGMVVYLLIRGRIGDLGLVAKALWSWEGVSVFQSIVILFGFGFLLVRLYGVLGRIPGILLCGVLYGVAKYPYYMGNLGMSLAEASGMIAFSAVVACVVLYLTFDRQDLWVPSIIHVFLDDIQNM